MHNFLGLYILCKQSFFTFKILFVNRKWSHAIYY